MSADRVSGPKTDSWARLCRSRPRGAPTAALGGALTSGILIEGTEVAGQGSICLYPWHSRVRSRKITVKSNDNLVYNSEYQVGKGYRVDTLSQKKTGMWGLESWPRGYEQRTQVLLSASTQRLTTISDSSSWGSDVLFSLP